jgi:hypothetical protein
LSAVGVVVVFVGVGVACDFATPAGRGWDNIVMQFVLHL